MYHPDLTSRMSDTSFMSQITLLFLYFFFLFVLCLMIGHCHLTEQMLVLKVYQPELFLRDCENLMMKGNYQVNSNYRVLLYLLPPFPLLTLL